jgi:hypothetical protein
MSHLPDTSRAPGPECYCGSELKAVPVPEKLKGLAGYEAIWVHVHNGDTRCYPGSAHPDDATATGEPADFTPGAAIRRGVR